jgi:DNA (cytosine-5)-methyltransferase 1
MIKKIKFIDLFCGIGGFHEALKNKKTECVFSSEWDKDCQKIYNENFGITPEGDITKINEKDIPKHDLLCAGFPCQAFSISGKQKGFEDTRGTLFFDVARIVKYHKPKVVFLENVKNFETHDEGKTLKTVQVTMDNLGYNFYHKVINSSNYGVPQNRPRIYMVAFLKKLKVNNFIFPKPLNENIPLKDLLLPDNKIEEFKIKRKDIVITKKIIQKDIFGSYPSKPIRIGTVGKGGQGERIYDPRGHAIALTAYGGGIGSKTGLYFINGKIRKLTPRECARVSGYPDSFKISDSKTIAYKQFGNTVVVKVINLIFKQILKTKCFN